MTFSWAIFDPNINKSRAHTRHEKRQRLTVTGRVAPMKNPKAWAVREVKTQRTKKGTSLDISKGWPVIQ